MRRYLANSVHVTMISVWAFAAVLCLPTSFAATLVAFLFAFASWQQRSQRSTVRIARSTTRRPPVLAALAASTSYSALLHHLPAMAAGGRSTDRGTGGPAGLPRPSVFLVLTTVYFAVGPLPLTELLPEREEISLELGTLVLGLLTAETIVAQPWLTPLVLVVMVLLQRSSLVSQLELAAATDAKTGLLNAAAWQELAQRELLRSQHDRSPCAVLLLDLDHFKTVNDTLGHLAGDSALRAIGEAFNGNCAATTPSPGSAARSSWSSCTTSVSRRARGGRADPDPDPQPGAHQPGRRRRPGAADRLDRPGHLSDPRPGSDRPVGSRRRSAVRRQAGRPGPGRPAAGVRGDRAPGLTCRRTRQLRDGSG